jgi:alkylhydroperoxidase family enzyme
VEEKDWPRTRRLNFSGWLAAATDAVARTRNGTWVGHVRVASENTSDGGGSIVLGAHRRDPNSSTPFFGSAAVQEASETDRRTTAQYSSVRSI